MKIVEVTPPIKVSDKGKMYDLLKSTDNNRVDQAYTLNQEIRKDSTINNQPYIKLPGKILGNDLQYMINTIETVKTQLINSGLSSENQIIKLMDESLSYLTNKI